LPDGAGHLIGHLGRGRAGPRTVEEAERAVEAHFVDQLQRELEIALRLAGKADDEVRRQRKPRPRSAQAAHDRFVFEHGIAALHRCQHPIGARLHGQVTCDTSLSTVA
jgi:hypothetical protein